MGPNEKGHIQCKYALVHLSQFHLVNWLAAGGCASGCAYYQMVSPSDVRLPDRRAWNPTSAVVSRDVRPVANYYANGDNVECFSVLPQAYLS